MKKFEITEEQIKQAYDAACEDWKQRIKEWFPEWNNIIEVNKWYYMYDGFGKSLIYYTGENKSYGFNFGDQWTEEFNTKISCLVPLTLEEAPEKEVEERLIEEAKRRGYKEGCIVIDVIDNKEEKISNNDFDFWIKDGATKYYATTLELGNRRVFNRGKWAEIISKPDEYITVNNIKYKRC